MSNLSGINLKDVKDDEYSPIPNGRYLAIIESSEMKTTKSGGEMLKLKWLICNDQYEGRYVFENLNLINDSDQAMQISASTLKKINKAVGFDPDNGSQAEDSSELHDKPCYITIIVTPGKNGFGPGNKITKYEKMESEEEQPEPVKPATAKEKTASWRK